MVRAALLKVALLPAPKAAYPRVERAAHQVVRVAILQADRALMEQAVTKTGQQ